MSNQHLTSLNHTDLVSVHQQTAALQLELKHKNDARRQLQMRYDEFKVNMGSILEQVAD